MKSERRENDVIVCMPRGKNLQTKSAGPHRDITSAQWCEPNWTADNAFWVRSGKYTMKTCSGHTVKPQLNQQPVRRPPGHPEMGERSAPNTDKDVQKMEEEQG